MFKDLQFTLFFVRDFITTNGLSDKYQQLISSYQQLQSSPSEELTQATESIRNNIADIHTRINYAIWSAPKMSILKHIGAVDLMGLQVVERINNVIIKNGGNSSAIIQGITQLKDETANLLSKTENLIQALNLQESIDQIEKDKQIVEVSFEENAILKNFWEMQDRGKEWAYIVRAFTRLTGQEFESVKILAMNSASPEIGVILTMFTKTANAIVAGEKAAAVLKKMRDTFFGKKRVVESLSIRDKKTFELVMKDVELQYEDERKAKIGEMTMNITKEYGVKKPDATDEHEIENMVGIALEKLSNLLGDGARVIDPSEIKFTGEESPKTSLGKLYSEIKKLEANQEITPLLEAETKKRTHERRKKMQKEFGIKDEERNIPTRVIHKTERKRKVKKIKTSKLPDQK